MLMQFDEGACNTYVRYTAQKTLIKPVEKYYDNFLI